MLDKPHLHLELVAGHDRAAETHLVDSGEHEQAAPPADYSEREDRGRLRKCFKDQNTGHHRLTGEMSGKELFVDGHVLECDRPFDLEFQHTVDQ